MACALACVVFLTTLTLICGQMPLPAGRPAPGPSQPRPQPRPQQPPPPPIKVPKISNAKLQELVNQMWHMDHYAFENIDNHIQEGIKANDNQNPGLPLGRLFDLDESKLFASNPVAKHLLAAYAEFDSPIYRQLSGKVVGPLLGALIDSGPMGVLKSFIMAGDQSVTEQRFRDEIHSLWFVHYPRVPNCQRDTPLSSGFIHVFLGEFKEVDASIGGFHSWLRYAHQQRKKACNQFHYFGYHLNKPNFLTIDFKSGRYSKNFGSFFYGTSPEFDLAVFTLCHFTRAGKNACNFNLHSGTDKQFPVSITTHSFEARRDGRTRISTAYPCTPGQNCADGAAAPCNN